MKPIGIGVIGCGYWGINYVRVFDELPDSRVVAVCDLSDERLTRVQQRFRYTRAYHDARELLSDGEVSAVVVATPFSTHYALAKACLQQGRHVLVEKPFVADVPQGEELI